MSEKLVPISNRVPESLARLIRSHAEKTGMKSQAIVTQALRDFFKRHKAARAV